MKAARCFDSV